MKNGIIFFLVASLVLSYNAFASYEYHQETSDLEYLLNERIEIMNEFIYGEKDMEKLNHKLSKIEDDDLLQNDLDILQKIIDNPTDFELSLNVAVEEIVDFKKTDEEIIMVVFLKWQMSGYDGEYDLVKKYNIKYKTIDKDTYLTYLEYIE
jgi:DNA replicative helicase MCM subunit Mcm2 (Cdc46/Mcm family)